MPINWQDGAAGGTPLSAANLNRLAVIEDVGITGTPTGDAVKAVAAAQVTDTAVAQQVASGASTAAALKAAFVPVKTLAVRAADYGAVGDGHAFSDGAVTAGSTTFTSAGANFSASDVGKIIGIAGAGSAASTTLAAAMSTTAPTATLPVAALAAAIPYGTVTVNDGAGHSQTFTASSAAAGATTIPIRYAAATFAFPSGTPVTAGTPLITTIAAVTNKTTVKLAAAAQATASGTSYVYGTDNTAALQNALNEGHRVFLDAGSYLTGTLTLASETTLYGPNGSGMFLTTSRCARLLLKPGTNGPLLTGAASGAQYVAIRDVKLDGQSVMQTAQAPLINQPDLASAQEAHWTLETLFCTGASGVGIYLGVNNRGSQVRNSYVYINGSHGIQCEGTDNQLHNNYIGLSTGFGVYCHAGGWSNLITGNNIWSNRVGIRCESVYGIQVIANFLDTNYQEGISADSVGGLTIVGNQFSPQSQAMDQFAACIELSNMSQNAMVAGNSFFLPSGATWSKLPSYCIHSSSDWIDGGNARQGGETRFGYSGGTGNDINDLRGVLTHRGAKAGFYSATPVTRPTAAALTAGYAAGTSTAVTIDGKFTGNTGATAYTVADIVNALKTVGLLTP